ncbi:transposase [Streptomyces hygroscopicus subsp. limoneus]|nr:transposase [Streptomyces hygroscopicus subsp. limoneus]
MTVVGAVVVLHGTKAVHPAQAEQPRRALAEADEAHLARAGRMRLAPARHRPRSAITYASEVSGRSSRCLPISACHRLRRGSRGGRPPAFDREACKQRHTVERCINRLKQWRGIATCYEKTATICLAGLHLAGIFLRSAR